MKHDCLHIILLLCVMLAAVFGISSAAAASGASEALSVTGYIGIYSKSTETLIRRENGTSFCPANLKPDEFMSFCFSTRNVSGREYEVRKSYVKISGGKELVRWQSYRLSAGDSVPGHVYWINMKDLGPGTYRLEYYANDQLVTELYFTIMRDWSSAVSLPSAGSIRGYSTNQRSPYICCEPQFSGTTTFTEYSVDLRIDHGPNGTYVCGCNWDMELDTLRKQYASVYRDYNGVAAYAGFQVWDDGSHAVIMSVWNTYGENRYGNRTVFRPKVVYSAKSEINQSFDGEGNGTQCLFRYDWKIGKTYRMLIQTFRNEQTGNCQMAMWICDLESMSWTRLIEYDLGIPSKYINRAVVFLEDYLTSTAAEIRSMELSNFRARNSSSNKWVTATKALFSRYSGTGSYAFGSGDRSFWAITTGIPNIWPAVSDGNHTYSVKYAESGSPY